jgi:protein TonB
MLQLASARPVTAPRPPRTAGVLFITVLHSAMIYAFLTALDFVPAPPVPIPIITRTIIEENKDPPPPIPENPLVVPAPPPVAVTPIIELQLEPPPSATALVVLPPPTPLPTPIIPRVTITPAQAVLGTHTTPDYPILSRRLGEQGPVRLALTIGDDGMVKAATVKQSSGFHRLDEAAVDWVRRHWRYRPAMRGVMPVESMIEVVLQFRLTEDGR